MPPLGHKWPAPLQVSAVTTQTHLRLTGLAGCDKRNGRVVASHMYSSKQGVLMILATATALPALLLPRLGCAKCSLLSPPAAAADESEGFAESDGIVSPNKAERYNPKR